MLPRERRLRTKDINRLFNRTDTQKIVAYPFVYFLGKKRVLRPVQQSKDTLQSPVIHSQKIQPKAGNTMDTYAQWGIQISNKFSKSAVKRHILKRSFYDLVERLVPAHVWVYYILAVPQKNRLAECTQLLATADKTTIVNTIQKQYTDSLSLFVKRLWSSAESKKPWQPSNNVKNVWKAKKLNS